MARNMKTVVVSSMVRGYRVYRTHWEPYVEEEFVVLHEADDDNDRHAMAVYHIHKVNLVKFLPELEHKMTCLE